MNPFGWLLGRARTVVPETTKALGDDPAHFAVFGADGVMTRAGVAIGPESAMRIPAFAGAVRLISGSVAILPARLMRIDEDGSRTPLADDPRARLFDHPNPWTPWPEFVEEIVTSALLHGRGCAFVNRVAGEVRELITLPGGSVSVTPDPATLEPIYRISLANQASREHRRDEIVDVHLAGARSMVTLLRETLGVAASLTAHAGGLFGRGVRAGGFLIPGKPLGPEGLRRLGETFTAAYAGPERAGGVIVLPEGMSFKEGTLTSVDAQFLETWRFVILEIARAMRVSAYALQQLERATYSNAEHANREFVTFTLLHWVRLVEGALEIALLTPEERLTMEIELDLSEFTRADTAARAEADASDVLNGIASPNEVRATRGKPPYAGGEVFRRPLNTAPEGTP